jgi:hypothetical protein
MNQEQTPKRKSRALIYFVLFMLGSLLTLLLTSGVFSEAADSSFECDEDLITNMYSEAGTGQFVVPAEVYSIEVEVVGGGGGGGGPAVYSGGGGGYAYKIIDVTPGEVFNYVVGEGGTPWG